MCLSAGLLGRCRASAPAGNCRRQWSSPSLSAPAPRQLPRLQGQTFRPGTRQTTTTTASPTSRTFQFDAAHLDLAEVRPFESGEGPRVSSLPSLRGRSALQARADSDVLPGLSTGVPQPLQPSTSNPLLVQQPSGSGCLLLSRAPSRARLPLDHPAQASCASCPRHEPSFVPADDPAAARPLGHTFPASSLPPLPAPRQQQQATR